MSDAPWSVILAAGRGRRLASVTGGVPKQFWAPHGNRTLLEHTVDRMAILSPLARIVTVVDRSQREYAETINARTPVGRLTYQAGDRGTAAGVLRGLVEVASDPDGLVVLTPSDHGVARPGVFRQGIREAKAQVRAGHTGIVLLAVQPDSPTGDFGWIVPDGGAVPAGRLPGVSGFVEKPHASIAANLFAAGAVWNTMVMVARVGALLDLYSSHLPALAGVFREARAMPAALRDAFLADRYPNLPHADFSRDVLTPARGLSLYVWPESLGWTDLGTPDRLDLWLRGGGTLKQVLGIAETPRPLAAAS
jgi:mannose-1-phosphate guanylyltransferase